LPTHLITTLSRKLNAPRTSVFNAITSYEELQERFPRTFLSIRVVARSKAHVVTEEKFSVMGTTMTQRSRHKVRVPTTHSVEILTGDLAGSTIVEHYSAGPGGETTVRVDADFVLGGLLSLLPPFVARPLLEVNVARVFDELEEALARGSTAKSSVRKSSPAEGTHEVRW
jgi:carbon monoxide dehydrogenase subunit G